jgi:hypothetical protein
MPRLFSPQRGPRRPRTEKNLQGFHWKSFRCESTPPPALARNLEPVVIRLQVPPTRKADLANFSWIKELFLERSSFLAR